MRTPLLVLTFALVAIASGSGRIETLDADAGDPDAFLYTLEEDGATTSYLIDRTEGRDLVPIDPTGGDALAF